MSEVELIYQSVLAKDKERAALLQRAMETLARSVIDMPKETVQDLQGMNDLRMLSTLIKDQLEHTSMPMDRKARMRLKGIERFRQLVENSGGVFTIEEAAKAAGTTIEGVRRASSRDRQTIMSFKLDGQTVFPTRQFTQSGTVAGMSRVRKGMDNPSDEEFIRFMLTPVDSQETRTPLQLLASGVAVETVEHIARLYMKPGN